ncbi:unnamed protein product [Linum tenue]|uniref:FRIGIDA-like protein n=1 Tax=Linum tenue TaxID=586396 RepID=A0AAV0LCC4_9ROSI|nr:unnamed protein product [Linum tenue]
MNGIDLQIFLNERHKDLDTLKVEVQNALKLLSDPAKLVLDAMQGFYPPHLKKGDIEFEVDVVRKSCIMLLEQLANMSTEIKPTTRNEAMSLALDWMTKMKPDVDHFLEVLAFLQLLAAYRLASAFDVDELVIQFGVIAHYSQVRVLLQNLGFAEKMSGVIRKLLENNCQAEAGSLISAFDLHSEFLWTTSPKDDQVTGLGPSLEDKSTAFTDPAILFSFNAPSIPLVSRTLSGAKLSWSDACAYSDLTEYPDLGPESALNLHVQQPERLSSHEPQLDRLNIPAQQPDRLHIPDQQPERLNIQDQQSERLSNGNDQAICNIKFYEKVPLPSRSAFVPGCLKINGNLFTAVCSKIKGNQLRCREISVALQRASDPTEFVLGIVKNPSSLTLQKGCGAVGLASPQHGPLLLLDLLRRMSPHVNQDVEREALSFAREWRPKFPKHLSNPLEPVCFLLFLAAYKLVSYFDQDELFSVFGKDSYWCQNGTKLFGLLDFKDLIPKFLEYLMRNKLPLETLHCIKISNLLESSPSARTALKNYMHTCPKKLRGTEGTDEQVVSIGRELNVWKPVAESITDQTLAECFRDHISVLEKKLQALKNSEPVPGETPSVPELFDYQQQREVPVAAVKPASVPIFSDDQQEQPGKRRQRQGSGARCKRRRMSDIRNGLCSAPPLVSNTKLRLPQLPVPLTAPFRPPAAATVVYPNQFYGFPGHWYPLIPYRYHGHGR